MKSGKQTCQDFCWKVHDRAQSFSSRSYTMHELRSRNDAFSLLPSQQVFRFVHGQGQKSEQKHPKRTLSGVMAILP